MSDNVTPLFGEPEDPHMEGPAICMECRHQWHGITPEGTTELECPSCGTMKGVFRNPAFHASPHWECNCGNEFFVIHEDRFVCAHCGTQQVFP